MKIVINARHGGFSLSEEAEILYKRYAMIESDVPFYARMDIQRNDQYLVKVVAELGEAANGSFADLKIVEIPDDVDWEIAEYDGAEWVAEVHRTWQ